MSTIQNNVQLIGHLGNNPEVKTFESGKKLASFSLATNDQYRSKEGEKKEETQWHNIVAWGKKADLVQAYCQKGKHVALKGKISYRSYENSEGEKRYITEIIASEILLLGSND